jgi:hypothetical protein
MNGTIALWLALLVAPTQESSSRDSQPSRSSPTYKGSIVGQHLARLDAGEHPVPIGWVRQIDDSFAALERKCWQRRGELGEQQSIADMAFRSVRELRQAKMSTTHLEFLMTMTQFVPRHAGENANCAEVAVSVAKSLKDQHRDRR